MGPCAGVAWSTYAFFVLGGGVRRGATSGGSSPGVVE